jgi:hypothetical protein
MARVWRDGQRKDVFVYRFLTAGTIEEKMFQRQILKEEFSNAVVDTDVASKRNFSRDELRELFSLAPPANVCSVALAAAVCRADHALLSSLLLLLFIVYCYCCYCCCCSAPPLCRF